MNIVTRLALIEQLLEDAALEAREQPTAPQLRWSAGEGRRLVDELDQAQMIKAASHLRPAHNATI
ncbi:MAG TPA: hypothetical protein VFH48_16580 [Chloroflexota bacterium]|nr:hypothetical protein [Chloroflexota bacterium]